MSGSLSMSYFPIRELSTYRSKWTIRARVTHCSPLRSFKQKAGGDGKVFSVDLLDAEGGEIRASFFNSAVDKFYDSVEVGKCFVLSRGHAKIANRQYNTCKHHYELVFDTEALVEEVADDGLIGAVGMDITELQILQTKRLPCTVDICGIIASFDPVHAFTSKGGKEFVKRVLVIADYSGASMDVTLWGDMATKEDAEFEGRQVIAMKGVFVKEWQGGIFGSLSDGGKLLLQPSIPEVANFNQAVNR